MSVDVCCVKGCCKNAVVSNGKLQFCRKHAYAVEWYYIRSPYERECDRRAKRIMPIAKALTKAFNSSKSKDE